MWVARDKDYSLWLYTKEPIKGDIEWKDGSDCFKISTKLFPSVVWNDTKATKVELVIKK